MTAFTTLTSPATPFFRDGVSTDVIYAGPRADLAAGIAEQNVFKQFRYDETGRLRPESPFDKSPFDQSAILIVARGFGRGRTPDVAAKALMLRGIVCIIGGSFAPAFEREAQKAGILPIMLDYDVVKTLAEEASEGAAITIDLPAERIVTYHGDRIPFTVEQKFREEMIESAAQLLTTRSKASSKKQNAKLTPSRHLFYSAAGA